MPIIGLLSLRGQERLHHVLHLLFEAVEAGVGVVDPGVVDPFVELGRRLLEPLAALLQYLDELIAGMFLLISLSRSVLIRQEIGIEQLRPLPWAVGREGAAGDPRLIRCPAHGTRILVLDDALQLTG
jgi:hypothetical protein